MSAALIPYEDPGRLLSDPGWYEYLFHRLGHTAAEFEKSKLSVITFNYERSFEEFLHKALIYSFGMSVGDAWYFRAEYVPVVHVHGQLGALAADPNSAGRNIREYENTLTAEMVRRCASDIRIVSDSDVDDSVEFGRAHQLLDAAEAIVFLGFGYLPTNVSRLQIRRSGGSVPCYGSRKAVFDGELPGIASQFEALHLAGNQDWDVGQFLRSYSGPHGVALQ
jgi:hypothetical protein